MTNLIHGKNTSWSSSPPPVGMVVVRETPPRVGGSSRRHTGPVFGNNTPTSASSSGRASASFSTMGAFRLQPRGGVCSVLGSPRSARNGVTKPASIGSSGRKRGSHFLAPQLSSSTPMHRKTLFPSRTFPRAGSTSSSTASQASSSIAKSPEETGFSMVVASPSRVENALQSLSLKSPVGTPHDQQPQRQQRWNGRASSPFHPYGTSPSMNARTDGSSMLPPRNRGDSIGSVASLSSMRTPNSASRPSPKLAPLFVVQQGAKDNHKHDESPKIPLSSSVSSHVVSFDGKRQSSFNDSPLTARTPSSHIPATLVQMHPSTPNTPHMPERPYDHHILSSSMRSMPSPHDTPLPKMKLTPRRPGSSPNDASLGFSPAELTFQFSPVNAGLMQPPKPGAPCSSYEPTPPLQSHATTSSSRNMTYLPMPHWSNTSPSPARRTLFGSNRERGHKSSEGSQRVMIRSLLAPCGPHTSPSLQAMVTADAEAAALDCDGSLTDDDDDDAPFVLMDPAALAAERCENSDDGGRPSQRRRMSLEDNGDGSNARSTSLLSRPSSNTVNQAPSSTSLQGMAFLRGDSLNSFGNSRLHTALTLDSNGSFESFAKYPSARAGLALKDGNDLSRIHDEDCSDSIGLDLDPSSSDVKSQGRELTTPPVPERNLHTPPAMAQDPSQTSPPAVFGPDNGSKRTTRDLSSVHVAHSNPDDVHWTIANMVMIQQQHHQQKSPPMACNS